MKGELILSNNLEYPFEKFSITLTNYDFGFELYIDEEESLEQQLKQKQLFETVIDYYIRHLESEDDTETEITTYKEIRENIDNFLDYIEYICINLSGVDVISFINNNSIFKNKKIVLPICFDVGEYDKIKQLAEQYKDHKDNLYVKLVGDQGYITISECLNTISKIRQYAEKIKSLNLSLMETIMYTYDQVRNKVYKQEEKNESALESRDLSSVLSGDKIVCVGYANIFRALLRYMNIDCYNVRLVMKNPNIKEGHERNIIYVKDEKYDIDGVYYFDVTWDSKRQNENNEFLNRYKFFAKTRKEMTTMEKDIYNYEECPYFSNDLVNDIKQVLETENLEDLNSKYAQSLNYMSLLATGKRLIDRSRLIPILPNYNQFDRKKLLENLSKIEEKFNKPISAEVYIKLLNNVRKIEYYENSRFYPYTIDVIYETYRRSGWKFARHYYDSFERFLINISGEETINENRNETQKDFINYFKEQEIMTEIKQVQLTKVLQKSLIDRIKP